MSAKKAWSRHSYPVQSSQMDPPPLYNAPPDSDSLPLPQLPKHIRAVQRGENCKATGRTLIVCLDGTGDEFDADNSNIVLLHGCLKKDDAHQLTYYQSGIGTYNSGGLSNGIAAALDMAIGSGLGVHVSDAYHFLMQTYREGDKICIFGFSRGAYTARCLAGMLHKVGLLPAHNIAQVPFAYAFYKDGSDKGWAMSKDFKRTFCIDVSVHFIGVFDCVASVGFIPRKLPFSSTPTSKTGHFRHAMALDEHRAKFKVCHWQRQDGEPFNTNEQYLPYKPATNSVQLNGNGDVMSVTTNRTLSKTSEEEAARAIVEAEKEMRGDAANNTDVLEVWFMGCHADVGGGAVKNEVRHKLSNIPLRWMIRQTFECNTGIIFNTAKLAEVGLDVHTLFPQYYRLRKPLFGPPPSYMEKYAQGSITPIARRSSALEPVDVDGGEGVYNIKYFDDEETSPEAKYWVPEQVEDHFDAAASINDQLVQSKGWWILEYWPIKYRVQKKDSDGWEKVVGMNLGRFRTVQEPQPNLHWTVHARMRRKEYKMRGRLGRNAVFNIVV